MAIGWAVQENMKLILNTTHIADGTKPIFYIGHVAPTIKTRCAHPKAEEKIYEVWGGAIRHVG